MKGAHDIILLAVKKIQEDEDSDKIDFPFLFYRANIFVESYSFADVSFKDTYQEPCDLKAFQSVLNKSVAFNDFKQTIVDTDISPARTYYLHVGNSNDIALRAASVILADGLSVAGSGPLFYKIDRQSEIVEEIQLKLPKKINTLFSITIENPFVMLEGEDEGMVQIPTRVHISNVIQFNEK